MEKATTKRRRRWSAAEQDELVAKCRASGLTVRQFAAENGLPASSVCRWIQSRKASGTKSTDKRGKRTSPARKPKASFAEVNVVGQAAGRGPTMTVALRCGHSVTFEGEVVDVARLEAVLKVIRAC